MTTTFREQVETDALAMGHPADVAAALARYAGKDPAKRRAAPAIPKGRAPRATAPGVTLAGFVRFCGLPAAVTSDFRSIGVATAEGAAPLLRRYLAASARNPASAVAALRMHLLTRAIYRKATAAT